MLPTGFHSRRRDRPNLRRRVDFVPRRNRQREELNSRRVADVGPDTTQESRHLVAFFRCFSTVESDIVERQVRQIVQSWLNLDDFLP